MKEYDLILMSLLVFLPAVFAAGLLVFPRRATEYMRWWTLLGTVCTLVVSLWVFIDFYRMLESHLEDGVPLRGARSMLLARVTEAEARIATVNDRFGDDWVGSYPWVPSLGMQYYLGIDGISMALVLLTTTLWVVAALAGWNIDKQVRTYGILFLILETGVLGTFLALDFFLFLLFWQAVLLPLFLLIGVWGGAGRQRAATRFLLFGQAGAVLVLLATVLCYTTDVSDFVTATPQSKHSFTIPVFQQAGLAASSILHGDDPHLPAVEGEPGAAREARLHQTFFTAPGQIAIFLLFFVGFGIGLAVVPFHTWLPEVYAEAPTPISMLLAGVMLKVGGYGLLRFACPICPWAAEQLAGVLAILGTLTIVHGGLVALAQSDFKRLIAYSSISQMGYVLLGVSAWAAGSAWAWSAPGAVFHMVAHGIGVAGLFFAAGIAARRAEHRNLDLLHGLFESMPVYGGVSTVLFFAVMGVPGLCGFVGVFMILLGTWQHAPALACVAALATLLTAGYLLRTLQRVMLGRNPDPTGYRDLTTPEWVGLVALAVLAVLLGVMPDLLLSWMEPSVSGLLGVLAR